MDVHIDILAPVIIAAPVDPLSTINDHPLVDPAKDAVVNLDVAGECYVPYNSMCIHEIFSHISYEINSPVAEVQQQILKPRQPLEVILADNKVKLVKGQAESVEDIEMGIQNLDVLIDQLSSHNNHSNMNESLCCEVNNSLMMIEGTSPGFETTKQSSNNQSYNRNWKPLEDFPHYEALTDVNLLKNTIPMASPAVVKEYFQLMRKAWMKRLEWASAASEVEKNRHCSCVGMWQHCGKGMNILQAIGNQTIEQVSFHIYVT